ncbi:MAG: hypothetical protein HQL96_08605 [Magnetococcales bacterium]|nr:hypothetical protein [Magnetococcales bacterium]
MKQILWLTLLIAMSIQGRGWAEECLSCHRQRDAVVTAAWEKSRHAMAEVTCTACHGVAHDGGMTARARRNEACTTGCHPRENGSHALSKHGVIAVMEGERLDFNLPLKEGNQRTPTCAYCHMHANEHDTAKVSRDIPCRDCHSPRFVETWFASGDQMVAIGDMKLREAEAVAAGSNDPEMRDLLHRMRDVHLRNVRLGVGHASPDDQWWHGHPALDGDLLRIKSLMQTLHNRNQSR